jgi:hypothetical protein
MPKTNIEFSIKGQPVQENIEISISMRIVGSLGRNLIWNSWRDGRSRLDICQQGQIDRQ